MAVSPENNYFKFVLVSDKSKSFPISKNDFTEKPSKDKDNMSTKTLPSLPNNNEKPDSKNNTVPELKIHDSNGEESAKQKNKKKNKENKSSRNTTTQNGLFIKVPSRSTSPQLVSSPIEIPGGKTIEPSVSPVSTSPKLVSPTGPSFIKNVGKKLGNIMKNNASDNANVQTTSPKDISEQEDTVALDSIVQTQREDVDNADNATPKPPAIDNNENAADAAKSAEIDNEDRGDGTPKATSTIPRSGSINKFANVRLFITRTSTALVEKLKEEFEELDKRIYPEMENWVTEDEDESSKNVNTERDEREQLLEYKDRPSPPPKDNVFTNGISQKTQNTRDVLSEVGHALNERAEKLGEMAEKTEELNRNASSFAEIAMQLRKQQEQKNKSWKFW